MKWHVITVLMDALNRCMKEGLNFCLDMCFCCRLVLILFKNIALVEDHGKKIKCYDTLKRKVQYYLILIHCNIIF